jgi:hypothetical protein
MRLEFGKYRGKDVSTVPRDYLRWLLRASRLLITELEFELHESPRDSDRRAPSSNIPRDLPSITRELVELGYKLMCKKLHPDLNPGMDDRKIKELNLAMEKLRETLK